MHINNSKWSERELCDIVPPSFPLLTSDSAWGIDAFCDYIGGVMTFCSRLAVTGCLKEVSVNLLIYLSTNSITWRIKRVLKADPDSLLSHVFYTGNGNAPKKGDNCATIEQLTRAPKCFRRMKTHVRNMHQFAFFALFCALLSTK
jgi:hypothetical protein